MTIEGDYGHTFICARCGGIFVKGWTDEEMAQEVEVFYGVPMTQLKDPALICDDCYDKLQAWFDSLPKEEQERLTREATQ